MVIITILTTCLKKNKNIQRDRLYLVTGRSKTLSHVCHRNPELYAYTHMRKEYKIG